MAIDRWTIRQTIDLARSGSGPKVWPEALMVTGDRQGHTWEITILKDGKPADLSRGTVTSYFTRADNECVVIKGDISGNVATVTLAAECYAIPGPMVGILRVSEAGGTTYTASVLRFIVECGPGDEHIDPGHAIPTLDELLAQIDQMEKGTAAANAAADRANDAADNANESADNADTIAGRLSEIDLDIETLPASANPTGHVTQTDTKTTIHLGIPTSNLAYSTFEVDDEMYLLMHSPDGFDDITFVLNDGVLEVHV